MSEQAIMMWSIGGGFFLLSVLTFIYMIKTAQPYPKELQDAEDEELLRKFKEYKDNISQK